MWLTQKEFSKTTFHQRWAKGQNNVIHVECIYFKKSRIMWWNCNAHRVKENKHSVLIGPWKFQSLLFFEIPETV